MKRIAESRTEEKKICGWREEREKQRSEKDNGETEKKEIVNLLRRVFA